MKNKTVLSFQLIELINLRFLLLFERKKILRELFYTETRTLPNLKPRKNFIMENNRIYRFCV